MSTNNTENIPPEEESSAQPEEEIAAEETESLQQLGQKIREARISKDLSLESISGHLHIGVKILEAIEEGKPENGPSPVFFRGLVHSYCQFLELEKTDIIENIDRLLKSTEPEEKQQLKTLQPVFQMKESHPVRNTLTVLVLVVGGILFYSLYFSQTPFFQASDNSTQTEATVAAVELENEKVKTEPVITEVIAEPAEIITTIPEKVESPEEIILAVEKQKEIPGKIEPEVVPEPVEPLTLEVEASKGTWISLAIDDGETEDIRIEADEIFQQEAKKQYLLTIGNTQVVRVLLNGREIETNRSKQLLTDWRIDKSFLP
ncbi:MAG: helix-turn-helix domain-containing protein [SAR324 cluster bacterium]|nr:helix-turn-helix domain-containing protein [SAR324 cluster bacterium]MBL7035772.1 helix-turn-helix domain-containing protein [SAR324 cluster bacterium]